MGLIYVGLGVVAIIALLVIVGKMNIAKSSKCKGCKKQLSYPDDLKIYAGPQKWVEKQY